MRTHRAFVAAGLVAGLLYPSSALAASAPDRGKAWTPKARSQPLYGSKPPSEDPDVQQHYVTGHDGTQLYVETWLPEELNGNVPPKRIPTILIMTPYVSQGVEEYPGNATTPNFVQYFNARGYAVAQHHVRGTGESGGCLEQTAPNQFQDGAYVVEYLGKEAPWSNGKVGMYGASYDAETQISTAAFGDPKKVKYLKAIIPTASVGGQYDWNYMDGVPWFGQPLLGNAGYLAQVSLVPGQVPAPQHYPEKLECQGEVMGESANQTGDFTEYWQEREYRPKAHKVKAATLMVHGLRDFNVQDITLAGFFDRLSDKTPHKGLFGVWNHAFPSSHSAVEPDWGRADWYDMVTAWFDRYLKGLDTDVEKWPDVQVQSSAGEWWSVDEYPTTGGPLGQLALGADGTLGATSPKGESLFTEQVAVGEPDEGQFVVFETPKVKAPLHLTGQPMLDLWLMSNRPDGHVGAELEVIGPGGEPLHHEGSYEEFHATYGVRSLQHIDPMPNGWFQQEAGKEIAVNEPVKVTIRFLPTDLVVPKGGSLRLTIAGSVAYSKGESLPSGSASEITILHDCQRPSFLRFRMPDPKAQLLNVREHDEAKLPRLKSTRARIGVRSGAGLATAKVCGLRPRALPFM
ncbi:MAG TPA: CocE/NonD family hydrolase [Actinomycetota bacterium]|nr:CocE/NonD family hydrolase [Actinomycetota bacterium]